MTAIQDSIANCLKYFQENDYYIINIGSSQLKLMSDNQQYMTEWQKATETTKSFLKIYREFEEEVKYIVEGSAQQKKVQ